VAEIAEPLVAKGDDSTYGLWLQLGQMPQDSAFKKPCGLLVIRVRAAAGFIDYFVY
jgi:hypothetical protein